MTAVKFFTRASLVALMVFLSACGWHLRGDRPIPDDLRVLHLKTANPDSELSRSLQQAFTKLGVTLTKSAGEGAPLSLFTSELREQRRAVSTSGRGKDAEYALTSSLDYQVKNPAGQITSGPVTLSVEKVYLFDPDNVLGSHEEEQLLRREMQRDLVQQLLRRYRALKINQAAP